MKHWILTYIVNRANGKWTGWKTYVQSGTKPKKATAEHFWELRNTDHTISNFRAEEFEPVEGHKYHDHITCMSA